jgi:hypothetical protein
MIASKEGGILNTDGKTIPVKYVVTEGK